MFSWGHLRRGAVRALVVVAFASLTPIPQAHGQSAAQTQWQALSKGKKAKRKKKAKRYEKKAKKAFRKKAWDDAIVAFELAYKKVPDPRYLFNIGRCYEKKDDLFTAMEYTQRYVQESQAGDEREDAEEMVAMLQARLKKTSGVLAIRTTPAGATFTLSGKGQELAGTTPIHRWLLAGPWKLELSHPGHVPVQRDISIGLGQTNEITVALEAVPAKQAPPPGQAEKDSDPETTETTKATAPETADTQGAAPVAASSDPGPGWMVLGPVVLGATALAGAGAFGLMASSARTDLEELEGGRTTYRTVQDLHDGAEANTTIANSLFLVGGLATATGLVLYLVEDDSASTSVIPSPDGIVLQGRFP